ncbi:Tripartite-type tricarboxylate transporter, receptor component TctC [Cupriavidus sp. YR651]|uniref:tripartite tricarboxylate transporter substrate binding protein n=1 Tax=Cupriavidus sp. YR651 TaxID=1855315 RepID=UPI00087E93D0|nr:tripartite tricarboxylate transporter substrate binding protein [Cupriavidus sp. YR651]SDD83018.1 Tripartite-type tricarboxylate transporter, receptor component TctC [Cupriavidus sp. YR651]
MKQSARCMLLALLAICSGAAHAEWPDDRPIQVYVGFAAGGGTDTMARTMAPFIQKYLGGKATLVVQNKPGAAGEIANIGLMRARPDGYTVGVVNLPAMAFGPLYRNTQFKPQSLQLVARVLSDPTILVAKKDSPYNSLNEIVAALKKNPKSLTFGHNGVGTNGHLALLQLQNAAKVKLNDIPFNGTSQSKTALFGGHIDFAAVTTGEMQDVGKEAVPLKILVQMSDQRATAIPAVPTAKEQGVDDVMPAERGIAVPVGVPPQIVAKLRSAIQSTLKDPEYLKKAANDTPVLAFLGGDEWQKEISGRQQTLKKLAESMPKE